MAKLEPADGLVTMFRNSGSNCNAAASNKGNVRVSHFIETVLYWDYSLFCFVTA